MSNTDPTAVPAGDDSPHKMPSDAEEIYYEGSPQVRGLGLHLFLWPIVGVLVIVSPIFLQRSFMKSGVPSMVWLGCVVVGLIFMALPFLLVKAVRYRISNYRIDYERGFFSKDIDTLELWHVEDLHFHQSFIDRILGVGNIHVIAHDENMPDLCLRGIPHPRPLYETLKQRVIAVKRSRGVMKVDPG